MDTGRIDRGLITVTPSAPGRAVALDVYRPGVERRDPRSDQRSGTRVAWRDVAVGSKQLRVVDTGAERYGDFWSALSAGSFEPATVEVLCRWARPGGLLIDVGAWIGPFSLLAAAYGTSVVAIEPDPVAADVLRRHVAANPGASDLVRVDEVAWAAVDGRAHLASSVGLGNARSALLTGASAGTRVASGVASGVASARVEAVEVVTHGARRAFEAACSSGGVNGGPGRDVLLKIDIEGGEFAVVAALGPALARHQPLLLLSVHQPAPPGGVATLLLRLRRLPAMARLVWALRAYPVLWRARGHREPGWRRLGAVARLLLVARLGEFELLAHRDRTYSPPR